MERAVARRSVSTWGISTRHLVLATIVGSVVFGAIAARLLWQRFLDPFEDGYQQWWIASSFVETGTYADPFSGMTRGNWLPGYSFVAAGLVALFGSHIMTLLKAANILFSLGTTAVIYLIARPRGIWAATLAAVLFALNPIDIVISSFATPEALTLLATFGGVLLIERRPFEHPQSLILGSIALAFAATLRYEVWGFVAIYLVWTWAKKGITARELVLLAGPLALFAIGWWAWTSQFGFLPAIITSQTSTDLRYKASIGALVPAPLRLASFLVTYLFWNPFVFLALIWGVYAERKSAFTGILVFFYLAEGVYTLGGFGNPGPRYIHLTVPIVALYSASALGAVKAWASSRLPERRSWARHAPTVAALGLSILLVAVVVNPSPTPGTLLQGAYRAGIFLRGLPLADAKLVVSESPIAAYYSGYPASRLVGSTTLPTNASQAVAWLVDRAAYVVMVTVPYYRLRVLFPAQANGTSSNHLMLLYDATGAEYDLGAPRVLVFKIVP
jgi:hypothetical protein